MYEINETHDPNLRSWVESANDPNTDFPIQNLPFCTFRHKSNEFGARLGVRIGEYVLDFESLELGTVFDWWYAYSEKPRNLNYISDYFYGFCEERSSQIREYLVDLLRIDIAGDVKSQTEKRLYSAADCEYSLSFETGDYTDFYSSVFHATNVGSM